MSGSCLSHYLIQDMGGSSGLQANHNRSARARTLLADGDESDDSSIQIRRVPIDDSSMTRLPSELDESLESDSQASDSSHGDVMQIDADLIKSRNITYNIKKNAFRVGFTLKNRRKREKFFRCGDARENDQTAKSQAELFMNHPPRDVLEKYQDAVDESDANKADEEDSGDEAPSVASSSAPPPSEPAHTQSRSAKQKRPFTEIMDDLSDLFDAGFDWENLNDEAFETLEAFANADMTPEELFKDIFGYPHR
eukprot:TRINITY_DN7802_c0_g1::TRINITY_DN7802_c0_g1_i1::g.8177::m.8177 TRINITY_DN7802_c0_g1::TRINITY_DN7802_c0_g1_i1::g.8177  ORF type:complete len:266 (-),score=40.60,DUF935/PF06074.7/0.02 TRINITY_DN7802_c0_g1_i1:1093-1848(-)